jgi:hypothetical protein
MVVEYSFVWAAKFRRLPKSAFAMLMFHFLFIKIA